MPQYSLDCARGRGTVRIEPAEATAYGVLFQLRTRSLRTSGKGGGA